MNQRRAVGQGTATIDQRGSLGDVDFDLIGKIFRRILGRGNLDVPGVGVMPWAVIVLVVLGTAAYLFLLIVMIRKRSRRSVEWALLAAVGVTLLWYATGAITSFYEAGVGEQPSGGLERFLQSISRIGLALIPAALLQVAFAARSRGGAWPFGPSTTRRSPRT